MPWCHGGLFVIRSRCAPLGPDSDRSLLPTRKISSSLRKVILLRWWKPLSCARFWKKELSTHPETHLLRFFHSLSAQGSFARSTWRWSLFALFRVPVPQEM
ncbi:hypothetical protein HMPREF3039_02266 [Akkermansia sp. KLE1798]|nr:hypothetical protein HMPREF3039_02266 [Akkermansia sp. KLE1798]